MLNYSRLQKALCFLIIISVVFFIGCRNNDTETEETEQETSQSEAQNEQESEMKQESEESDEGKNNDRIQYVLYLKHQDQPFVFSDSHQIASNDERLQNKSLSLFVLEELLSQEGIGELINPIPKETKILSVENDGRTAVVNLSEDFVQNISGTHEDIEATIAVIVNSLITLPENDRVRLLIDGNQVDQIQGLPIQEEYEFITSYYPDK
ncbi:GerMN domain-containing protein [Tindallia californiensis]|uniref:Sporulation and spore germination n=1 Tax=Tindallia californiensis TaxID=159292 RepID=A0A1H3JJS2_9FIRM|nr:GerMN domain-containing protein [Tindallia californiensis]SDY40203.1 Sporulation and spore germination [Tindallia californiensis]